MKICSEILMILLPTLAFSQTVISGKIVTQENKNSIPYINIGIQNSNTGTISNKDGSFSIKIPDSLIGNDLIFSAIGFTKKVMPIVSFKGSKDVIIYLNEKALDLDEVVITSSSKKVKLKKSWFGNKKRPLFVQGQMHADTISAGGAMALLIDKTNYDLSFVEKVSLFIARNTLPEFKVRVRFLTVDTKNNNLPGKDLFNKNVVITSTIKRGWLNFDLAAYNQKITDSSYFLVLEWILDEQDRTYMAEILVQEHYESAIKAVSIFENDSLKFKPTTQFLYTSYGYNLLGAVIESVTRQTYLNYMQDNIWKPLDMNHTYGDVKDSIMLNKSLFYYPKGAEAKSYDLSYMYPAGGLISTTEDLLKFGNSMLSDTFLGSKFTKELFTKQYLEDGSSTNYGLG